MPSEIPSYSWMYKGYRTLPLQTRTDYYNCLLPLEAPYTYYINNNNNNYNNNIKFEILEITIRNKL